MTVVTAFQNEALRRTLEQAINGLEVELVYPKQSGDALDDPSQRQPKSATLSDWADIKFLISMTIGLSTAEEIPGLLTQPSFSMDDNGWIYLRRIRLNLKRCDAKMILAFKQDFPFSLPFSLPLNLPIAILLPTPLNMSQSLGQGSPLDVFRDPFKRSNLLGDLSSDTFGASENGLTLQLDAQPGPLAELNLDLKPRVCPTTRTEKITRPDGSVQEIHTPCWGLTFDGIALAGTLLPGVQTITHLLLDPLKQLLIAQTAEGLANLLKDDIIFQFTHKDLNDMLKYFDDQLKLGGAEIRLGAASAARDVAGAMLGPDRDVLKAAQDAERQARAAYIDQFNQYYHTHETDPEYPPSINRFPPPPPIPPPPFPPDPFNAAMIALGLAILAREAAQAKLSLDENAYNDAVREVNKALQDIADAKSALDASGAATKALALSEAQPIVAAFFNSLDDGMDLFFQLLSLTQSALDQCVMDWLDASIGLFNGTDGIFKQLREWVQEQIALSIVPRVIETDLFSQLPIAMKSMLNLLPLGLPIPEQPQLNIQQKEMSVVIELGDIP